MLCPASSGVAALWEPTFPTSVIEAPPRVTPVTESGLGAVSLHASAFLGGVSDVIETLNEVVSSLLKTASSRRPSFCAAYAVRFPLAFISTPSIVGPSKLLGHEHAVKDWPGARRLPQL